MIMSTPRDCYDVAAERGVSPDQAAKEMADEGWIFVGYNESCEELYREPKIHVINKRDIDYTGHQGIMDAIKFANPLAKVECNEKGGITITL